MSSDSTGIPNSSHRAIVGMGAALFIDRFPQVVPYRRIGFRGNISRIPRGSSIGQQVLRQIDIPEVGQSDIVEQWRIEGVLKSMAVISG